MDKINNKYSFTLNNPETLTRLRSPILIFQLLLVGVAYYGKQITYEQFSLSLLTLIPSFIFNHFFSQLQTTPRYNIIPLGLDLLTFFFLIFINGGIQNPFYLILLIHIFLAPFYLSKKMAFIFTLITLSCLFILPFSPYNLKHTQLSLLPSLNYPFLSLAMAAIVFWGFSTWLVSEIKTLNNYVQTSIKLQHRTDRYHSLGLLTAGICHELGTPLHTLEMRIQQLNKKLQAHPHLMNFWQNDLNVLLRNTKKCTNSIKKLNQKTHSEQHLLSSCCPLTTIKESINIYRQNQQVDLQEVINIQLSTSEALEHEKLLVKISKAHLIRCLHELFTNATEAGAKNINLNYSFNSSQFTLDICDNGEGFNSEILKHLGQPFVSSKKRGSGLGLYHLKNTIDYIGGSFSVLHSALGARIKIKLPLKSEQSSSTYV